MVCEEDTIGPPSIQGSIGGDGTDRQHGHADDEVGHQEHGDSLVQSGLAHHESWSDRTQARSDKHRAPGQLVESRALIAATSLWSKREVKLFRE